MEAIPGIAGDGATFGIKRTAMSGAIDKAVSNSSGNDARHQSVDT
jgi:hypothetical protein